MTNSPHRLARLLQSGGPFLGLLLVCVLFSLTEERAFIFTGGNLKNILTQTVIVAIGALGITLIIVGGGIDLSVGSVVAFTGVLGAKLLVAGWSPVATTLALVLVGGAIGLFNGAIVAGFRMMPFIVTLGMMGVVRGSAKWLGENQTVNAPPDSPVSLLMARVNPAEFWPLPPGVWIALGLAAVMALLLRETVFGRYVFAIGANETAARFSGVRVGWVKASTYAIAGLLFGFAGLLQMSRLTQGDPTVAIGLELDIIAAVVIGGASLNGGAGSIGGSLIGALIMALLRNGTNQLGWQTYSQEIIIGAVIVLAVGLDKWREARMSAR
ncbi:MAG: ABC transporter permease [Verrucomicrobia bacterium]|nr:ABC transporter permease [Verrucomicrobiota bacterium]